jgi:hypothetical protein
MSYIGYPVSLEEAIRLTTDHIRNQNESPESIQSDDDLNRILRKFTTLRHYWIDKNQCILGLDIKDLACQFWQPLLTVDTAILQILETKLKFKQEIARLNLDLSTVTFCHMEEEDSVHTNPEPLLFLASF